MLLDIDRCVQRESREMVKGEHHRRGGSWRTEVIGQLKYLGRIGQVGVQQGQRQVVGEEIRA